MSEEIPFVYQLPKKGNYTFSMRCLCGLKCSIPFEMFEESYVEALERKIKMLENQDTIHKQIHEKHSEREKQFLIMKQALIKIGNDDTLDHDGTLLDSFKQTARDALKRLSE